MSGPTLASLLGLHAGWSWVVVVANGLAGLWSLGAAWRPALRVRALWWFTLVAELAIFVEVGLGVALLGQDREVEDLHTFYGFLAIIAVAIIYSYRQQLRHRLYLLYGFGGLFLMGLCIRAMVVRPS
ncbi:MAG TPA: hypothetical protein VHG90_04120 [Acidimicrobiales bacterium]|nr:hypothetical protein [Acidimicrobiales bacterium]